MGNEEGHSISGHIVIDLVVMQVSTNKTRRCARLKKQMDAVNKGVDLHKFKVSIEM